MSLDPSLSATTESDGVHLLQVHPVTLCGMTDTDRHAFHRLGCCRLALAAQASEGVDPHGAGNASIRMWWVAVAGARRLALVLVVAWVKEMPA